MGQLAYPTGSDLKDYLEGAGLTVATALENILDGAATAGRQSLERAANRVFLADAADQTRTYDPPTDIESRLFIDDVASLTKVEYQPLNATVDLLTENEDFFTYPENAVLKGEPILWLEFRRRRWRSPHTVGLRRSIKVTGQFGYATKSGGGFPEDAFDAMLARAAWLRWGQVSLAATGGVLSWRQADVQVDYGVERWSKLQDAWAAAFTQTQSLYLRPEL